MALSNVRWSGMDSVIKMTEILPSKIAGSRLRESFRFAMKSTRDEMRANVRNRTGKLWHSIDITISGGDSIDQMYAVVGPRRKRNVWNQQGFHAHLVEKGTKPHVIKASPGKVMPVFTKTGFTGQFAKEIQHKGSRAYMPFSRAIDSTWETVGKKVADKVAEILKVEINNIKSTYGDL